MTGLCKTIKQEVIASQTCAVVLYRSKNCSKEENVTGLMKTHKDINSVRPPISPFSFPFKPIVDSPLKIQLVNKSTQFFCAKDIDKV